MTENLEFIYEPYEDRLLAQIRAMKATGEKHPAVEALPPSKVVCTSCPKAMWMWVEKTDPAKANAMRGFKDKAGWRCHCRIMNRSTYDEYASSTEPDAWVIGCGGRVEALAEHESTTRREWDLQQRAAAK